MASRPVRRGGPTGHLFIELWAPSSRLPITAAHSQKRLNYCSAIVGDLSGYRNNLCSIDELGEPLNDRLPHFANS